MGKKASLFSALIVSLATTGRENKVNNFCQMLLLWIL